MIHITETCIFMDPIYNLWYMSLSVSCIFLCLNFYYCWMTFVLLHAAVNVNDSNILTNDVFFPLFVKNNFPGFLKSHVQYRYLLVPLSNKKHLKIEIIRFSLVGFSVQHACCVSTPLIITLLMFCNFSSPS